MGASVQLEYMNNIMEDNMDKASNVYVSIPFYYEEKHIFNFGLKTDESGNIARFVEPFEHKREILDSYVNSKGELVIVVEM